MTVARHSKVLSGGCLSSSCLSGTRQTEGAHGKQVSLEARTSWPCASRASPVPSLPLLPFGIILLHPGAALAVPGSRTHQKGCILRYLGFYETFLGS